MSAFDPILGTIAARPACPIELTATSLWFNWRAARSHLPDHAAHARQMIRRIATYASDDGLRMTARVMLERIADRQGRRATL